MAAQDQGALPHARSGHRWSDHAAAHAASEDCSRALAASSGYFARNALRFRDRLFIVFPMHPDVAKLVEAGRIPKPVGERLSQLAPGNFCLHKSFGAGKVTGWDLPAKK